MSTELRDLMEERATRLPAPRLDTDAMVSTARGRIRRRRLTGVAVGAVLGTAALLVVPGQLGGDGGDTLVAGDTATTTPVAWVSGTTLHTDDGAPPLELDRQPASLVQGPSGYVFSDRAGTVYTVIDREVLPVGQLEAPEAGRFESDGDVVAWVDAGDGDPSYAVTDLSEGPSTVVLPVSARAASALERERGMGAAVAAVDGETVYLRTEKGADVWRPFVSDEVVPVPVRAGTRVELYDVKNGVFHYQRTGGTPAQKEETVLVGPDLSSGVVLDGWDGRLSPDGRHLVSETADENQVYDTATGERLPFDLGPYAFLAGYRWLDDDSYAALAMKGLEDTAVDLLRCDAPSGQCRKVAEQESLDAPLVLPFGEAW